MTNKPHKTRSVIVERDLDYPPHKVWRALTQPELIQDWLLNNDFRAAVGHRFTLEAQWGTIDCRVMDMEPEKTLVYTWEGNGLETVVTWTLSPTRNGTRLRMEQTGFSSGDRLAYGGARNGWPVFFDKLEYTLERLDEPLNGKRRHQ